VRAYDGTTKRAECYAKVCGSRATGFVHGAAFQWGYRASRLRQAANVSGHFQLHWDKPSLQTPRRFQSVSHILARRFAVMNPGHY